MMTVKSFITGAYRFCLLSLALLAVRATVIANLEAFGYWDKTLVTILFINGVFFIVLGALEEGRIARLEQRGE